MNTFDLGWSPFFENALSALSNPSLIAARVLRQDKNQYILHDGASLLGGMLLGKFQYDSSDTASIPTVGDWVAIQPFDDNQAVIHDILPRFSAFYRKEPGRATKKQVIAANIDIVFLVSGLDHDFNVRRIERYLVQTVSSGAEPVIVLNKADLVPNPDEVIQAVKEVARDRDVVLLSANRAEGFSVLRTYIQPGKTVAFLGSSGVGKSSIVNVLMDRSIQQTGAVRLDDSRGRHTTSHRELFLLPTGGIVIDTPGLRELRLWGGEEDVRAVFRDIELLAMQCHFRDCEHDTEPGCAVKQAIEVEELSKTRFESYLKLKREVAFLNQRQDEAARLAARKREKHFGKMLKEINKRNPKR